MISVTRSSLIISCQSTGGGGGISSSAGCCADATSPATGGSPGGGGGGVTSPPGAPCAASVAMTGQRLPPAIIGYNPSQTFCCAVSRHGAKGRTEERRVGKEWGRTSRTRGSPQH